jgi:hypothetical protein
MPTAPQHAIDAGMGGLLDARVLTEVCAKATTIERDALPDAPQQARGARQGDVIRTVYSRGPA